MIKKKYQQSTRSRVVGQARILSYKDILEAEKKQKRSRKILIQLEELLKIPINRITTAQGEFLDLINSKGNYKMQKMKYVLKS
jgi:hypothetical protein